MKDETLYLLIGLAALLIWQAQQEADAKAKAAAAAAVVQTGQAKAETVSAAITLGARIVNAVGELLSPDPNTIYDENGNLVG